MKFRLLVISTLITSFLFGEPPEKAIRYHEALKTRPMNEQLFSRFYDAWLEEAESEDLSKYLSESVSGWEGHVLMARYQMRVGKRKEAIESLTKSVKDAPENMNLKLMRAKLQIQELDFKSAVSDLEVVQKFSEGEVKLESTRLLGMSLLRLEEVDRALELWSNELEKSDAGMEFVEAEQALTTLKEALDSTGNDSWLEKEILRKSDLILARQGDAGAEAIFYQELAEKHGQRVQIKLAYARILASQDQWDNSQNIFKELLQANPNDHELRADFISLLVTGEKFEDALRELDVLIDQLGSAEPILL